VFGLVVALTLLLVVSSLASASTGSAAGPRSMTAALGTTYNATFNETGLPSGTNWSVHVSFIGCGCQGVHKTFTSNGPSIVVPLPNGSYRYNVLKVPGYFVNLSASGKFNVSNGSPATITFAFHPIIPFLVTFNETGLPNGTLWTVTVVGNGHGQEATLEHVTASSYGTSLDLSLLNGTYHYTVAKVPGSFFAGPSHGVFTVAGASPPTITVAWFTPPTYALSFTESGLAAGTNWSVRLVGFGGVPIHETLSSTAPTITFSLPSGTYRYAVAEVLGYGLNASTSVGHLSITNASVAVNVSFQALSGGAFYPVTFQETGLANGTHWVVAIVATHTFGHSRRAEQSSNGTTATLLLQNGTYRFNVLKVRGYTSNDSAGVFVVAGAAPAAINVTFSAIPTYAMTFSETGLPNGTNWSVLVRSTTVGSSMWYIRETLTSNASSIVVYLPNGSYCYRILPVPGYVLPAGTATGSITVAGSSPAGVTASFSVKG